MCQHKYLFKKTKWIHSLLSVKLILPTDMTRKPLKFCSLVEHSWILLPSCVLLQLLPLLFLLRQVHAMYFVSISGIRHVPNTHLAFLNPLRNIWQRRILFTIRKWTDKWNCGKAALGKGQSVEVVDYLFAWLFDKGVEFHRLAIEIEFSWFLTYISLELRRTDRKSGKEKPEARWPNAVQG